MITRFASILFILTFFLVEAHAQNVELTFRVDMSNENISPNGVHVAGSFQSEAGYGNDWQPGATSLEDPDNDQIFERTVMVPPGVYLYKFINGNAWGQKPELPTEDCAVNDGGGNFNREVNVGSEGIVLPVVKFDSCNAILKLAINMENEAVAPEGVYVMGDFQLAAGYTQNWDPSAIQLEDANGDNTYEANIPVPPGSYQYVFVNGNTTDQVESVPEACSVAGPDNLRVRSTEALIGGSVNLVNCFSTCDNCDPALTTNYDTHWWNDAVFYEIFVRSFYDSDGDGIGDFQGIIEKLDYLNDGNPETTDDLGVTGIWLMPMMESPSYHGYDVSNYYAIEPDYGTMDDFEAFLDAAHERGIKVIIDFVMNHSSTQHPWFNQSANNQNNFRDWYIWSDTNPGFNGPWGQNVWHQTNGDYYYGLFWGGMPDLNYDHPPVKEEIFNITEFWLDKGVDGFRLDAIKYLDENGSVLENTPETFQILEDFNDVYKTANPDAFTVGEVWSNTASIVPYVQNDRLDVCFEFDLAYSILNATNGGSVQSIRNQLGLIQSAYPKLQYATFLTNHDIDRVFSQLGNNPSKMKIAAATYLTLPGIPFVYYGEEIGMTGTGAHENIRRPMQWDASANAGFSNTNPWYPVGSNYTNNNVEDESNILPWYKQLIHLRNDLAPLRRGYLLNVDSDSEDLLSYARVYGDEIAIVVSNFGSQSANIKLSLPATSVSPSAYNVSHFPSGDNLGTLTLNGNGGFVDWEPGTTIGPNQTFIYLISENTIVSEISQLKPTINFTVFPNPGNDLLNLAFQAEMQEAYNVEVFSATGVLMLTEKYRGNFNQVNVSGLVPGVYYVKVSNEHFQGTERIIIGN